MDIPQRANAAQMAARNIKAKPIRRKTPMTPMRHESPTPQTFNPMASQNPGGGGLFGGSVQATGTFDFSAPAGGLSFPSPSFGASSNNPFAMNSASSGDLSGNESDSRADTTGEEVARAKKPFGGFGNSGTQQSNAPFQISNPTGQTQQGNLFAPLNAQDQSGGNTFSFGGTSHPGINFNNAPTQEKPASNLFAFGAASSQSASSNPSINFASGTSQDKPGDHIFSFGQRAAKPVQPQATNSGFNFGSPAPQEKPATPFSFGQGPATPSSSTNNFGSTQTIEKPATNLFGSARSSQDAPATTIFGSASQQPTNTSKLFTDLNAPASPSNNLFAPQTQKPAPASNGLFGGQSQQPAQSTLNVFASSSQAPASSNGFAEQQSQPAPTNNLFGNLNQPLGASSSLFSGPPSSSASNLFGSTDKGASSAGDLFGHLNKPINEPTHNSEKQPKVNGDLGENKNLDAAPNLFSNSTSSVAQTPSTGQHGGSKPLVSYSDVCRSDPFGVNCSSLLPASTLYGRNAEGPPVERVLNCAMEFKSSLFSDKTNWRKFSGSSAAPVETSKSKPTFSFESNKSAAPDTSSKSKTFSPMKPIDAPARASQPPPSGMFSSLSKPTEGPRKPGVESSRVMAPPFSARDGSATDISSVLVNRGETREGNSDVQYPQMLAAIQMSDESMAHMIPARFSEEQRQDFYVSARLRVLNNAMQKVFGAVTIDGDINSAMAFYSDLREQIKRRRSTIHQSSKRKVVDDENQENENPNKRTRQLEYSNTSASQITREEPASATKGSRTPAQSQPHMNGALTPKVPPSAASQLTAPPTSPAPKGKRKAEVQLTKDDHEAEEAREARQIKTPRLNGGTGGSNTSNIFKNILDSPTKVSPAKPTLGKKMIGTAESSNDEGPRFNPFGNLPVPSVVTKSSNPSAPASTFTPKSTTSTANPFQLKPAASGLTSSQKGTTIKPPTFGSVQIDFLQQFGQKAKDSEEKLMKAAKEEDMDSDEDEAEWEAKYHEKRRAELKAIDDVAKSKRATFVPGKGFTYGQIEKPSDTAESDSNSSGKESTSEPSPTKGVNSAQNATGSKSLFSQNTAPQSSGNSIFGSLNGSRTSTPGPFTSPTGSVLDGHKPGIPMPFGNNIFSHLSDSGADSGKGDDGDDDSGGGDSDAEEDSENKDPSYQPDKEIPSSPGTPAEETGPGLASAKKANIFSFGSSKFGGAVGANPNSGTNSPGGSIFDRISKDSDGNPIRHVSTEEKENTQPSNTVNVFADTTNPFSRSFTQSDGPADKTWKPSTPIKFSSTMPNNGMKDPAPTVSVTEATPTKAAIPFANLFGNSGSSKPTSSLTAAPTSAGVGFGFGNPSSTTSSLFPSAAASTTTSRATSPGGTTDGDSAAEGDPDAEQHEQIDLTKGGIGEENEEVVHEVRAKAIKFSPKEDGDNGSPWETKGVGPLRVLKDKENNAARILIRADPSGTIVLNKGILPQVNYEAAGKTLKLLIAGEGGKSLETWILQVKTPDLAKELATVLESNKQP